MHVSNASSRTLSLCALCAKPVAIISVTRVGYIVGRSMAKVSRRGTAASTPTGAPVLSPSPLRCNNNTMQWSSSSSSSESDSDDSTSSEDAVVSVRVPTAREIRRAARAQRRLRPSSPAKSTVDKQSAIVSIADLKQQLKVELERERTDGAKRAWCGGMCCLCEWMATVLLSTARCTCQFLYVTVLLGLVVLVVSGIGYQLLALYARVKGVSLWTTLTAPLPNETASTVVSDRVHTAATPHVEHVVASAHLPDDIVTATADDDAAVRVMTNSHVWNDEDEDEDDVDSEHA